MDHQQILTDQCNAKMRELFANPEVKLEAKGVYAYLISCIEADDKIFPNDSTIILNLKISMKLFNSCIDQLEKYGYVKVDIKPPCWQRNYKVIL